MAAIDEGENKEKNKKQFANLENHSKQILGLEHQNIRKHSTNHGHQRTNPQNIENPEEKNKIQHSIDL